MRDTLYPKYRSSFFPSPYYPGSLLTSYVSASQGRSMFCNVSNCFCSDTYGIPLPTPTTSQTIKWRVIPVKKPKQPRKTHYLNGKNGNLAVMLPYFGHFQNAQSFCVGKMTNIMMYVLFSFLWYCFIPSAYYRSINFVSVGLSRVQYMA